MSRNNWLKIITRTDAGFLPLVLELCEVEYEPAIKYRTEAECAFDPTWLYRDGQYSEDDISCKALCGPVQAEELVTALKAAKAIWIEFTVGETTRQLPAIIDKLPKYTNSVRYRKDIVEFSFKALYETITPIDFSSIYGYGNNYGANYGF